MIHPALTLAPDQSTNDVTVSGRCTSCGESHSNTYTIDGVRRLMRGELIQLAMPTVNPSKREWLKTAICTKCLEEV